MYTSKIVIQFRLVYFLIANNCQSTSIAIAFDYIIYLYKKNKMAISSPQTVFEINLKRHLDDDDDRLPTASVPWPTTHERWRQQRWPRCQQRRCKWRWRRRLWWRPTSDDRRPMIVRRRTTDDWRRPTPTAVETMKTSTNVQQASSEQFQKGFLKECSDVWIDSHP